MSMELELLTADKKQIDIPSLSPEDLKIVSKIRSTWKDWRSWFDTNHKERIRDNYKRYNATVEDYDDVDDQWRGVNGHPVRLAIEYAVAETYKTRLLKAILGNLSDLAKVLPTKKSTSRNADLMDKICYHYRELDDFTGKVITFVDQAIMYGSVPWLVFQRQKKENYKETIQKIEPVFFGPVQVSTRQVQEEVDAWRYIENRPTWEVYDIEAVGFNYMMGKYEKSPYFIFRQILHRSELRQMYPQFAEYFDSGLLDWSGTDDFNAERQADIGKSMGSAAQNEGQIDCLYWLEPEGMVITFADKLLLRYENSTSSKHKEVYTGMLNLLPKSFEPYGLDLITLTSQFADLWNEIINIDVDSTKLATNLMWKIKKDSATEFDTIYAKPGNQWLVENMEDVQQVQTNYQPGSALRLLGYISQENQKQTGAADVNMAVPSDAKFASDISRMMAESNYKYWLAGLHIKRELKNIIRAYVHHIQEYVAPTISPDNPIVFMITGEKGFDEVEINNPADLEGDFDYRISLEIEDLDRNLIRAQLIQALDVVTKNPLLSQSIGNPAELNKILFKMFPNIKELENVVGSPAEQLKLMLDKLSAEQLMQVMGYLQQAIPIKQAEQAKVSGGPSGQGGMPRVPVRTQVNPNPAPGLPPVAGANAGSMSGSMFGG